MRLLAGSAVGVGIVIGLALWPSDGHTKKCITGKLSCDSPVGCELEAQMLSKWGSRAIFRDKTLADQARAQAEATVRKDHPQATDALIEEQAFVILQNAAHEAAEKVAIKACPGSKIPTPPGFDVKYDDYLQKCKMTAVVGTKKTPINDVSKDPYTLVPDACDEMIDASRVHEGHHMDNCNKQESLDKARREEVEGYTLEIHFLRDEMRYVGGHCTPTPKRRKSFIDDLKKAAASAIAHQGATP